MKGKGGEERWIGWRSRVANGMYLVRRWYVAPGKIQVKSRAINSLRTQLLLKIQLLLTSS